MKELLDQLRSIKLSHLLIFLLPLAPIFFLSKFSSDMARLSELESKMYSLKQKSEVCQQNKKQEDFYFAEFKKADPFYGDKQLKSLVFLEPEKMRLEALFSHGEQDETKRKRLQFLKEQNKLGFTQEATRRAEGVVEIEEKMKTPVELNEKDLRKLLSHVEGVAIDGAVPQGRPQYIIKNFHLLKKSQGLNEKVFAVQMDVIRREAAK